MPGVLAVLTGEDAHCRRAEAHPASCCARHGAGHRAAQSRRLAGTRRAPLRTADRSSAPCRHRGRLRDCRDDRSGEGRGGKSDRRYEPLPAVTEGTAGAASDAPRLYDDLPNVLIDAEVGDAEATERRSRAPPMSRGSTPGSTPSPACRWSRAPPSASYDAESGRHTLYAGSGGIVRQKRSCRRSSACRSTPCASSPTRSAAISARATASFPEFALVVWGAKRVGRPVKWTCERSEAFVTRLYGPRSHGVGRTGARCRRTHSGAAQHRTSATSAPTPAPTCHWSRASGLATAGLSHSRPRTSARARCCPTRMLHRRHTAAPAGRKSSTSWSG